MALDGISLRRGRGIPRNSSLPIGTQEFLGKRKRSTAGKIHVGTKEIIEKIPSEFLCMTQN